MCVRVCTFVCVYQYYIHAVKRVNLGLTNADAFVSTVSSTRDIGLTLTHFDQSPYRLNDQFHIPA